MLPEPINAIWCFSFHQTSSAYKRDWEWSSIGCSLCQSRPIYFALCHLKHIKRKEICRQCYSWFGGVIFTYTHRAYITDTHKHHIITHMYCIHIHILCECAFWLSFYGQILALHIDTFKTEVTHKTIFLLLASFRYAHKFGKFKAVCYIDSSNSNISISFFGWSTSYTKFEWQQEKKYTEYICIRQLPFILAPFSMRYSFSLQLSFSFPFI